MVKGETLTVKIGNKKLKIKNCKGLKSAKGLMFSKLEDVDGALIYANNVWMPFMIHQLDLFFLDKNFKIIDYQKAVPISSNPETWKVHYCKDANYCLEVRKGLIKNPQKKEGNKVKIVQ